jgi:probable rRNA maturation factor
VPLQIEIADEQQAHAIDRARLARGVRLVLEAAGIITAEISVAVVADARMQALNRQYLGHDYPTDVLSFVLEHDPQRKTLEGQIVVSADYAAREAARYGWTAADELLLYAIHGALHLAGHDDTTPEAQRAMREAEAATLARFGLEHRFNDAADA